MDSPIPHPPFDTLLLEGGSLRCAFTAGVLDAFAAVGFGDFNRIYAVSAGAMAVTSFLAESIARGKFWSMKHDL